MALQKVQYYIENFGEFPSNHPVAMNASGLTSASVLLQSELDLENLTKSQSNSTAPDVASRWVTFFEVCVLIIGVLGSAANGLVFAVLLRSRQSIHRPTYLLILNQLVLDLFSCVLLVASYVVKLSVMTFEGRLGLVLCLLLDSEMILWIGLDGSTSNLICITLERYAKIIHPMAHRKHFRPWMIRAGIALAWFNGLLSTLPVTWTTSGVFAGQCHSYAFWHNHRTKLAYGVYYFCWDFVVPLLIFSFCYARIYKVIRRRIKISPVSAAGSTSLRSTIHINLWRQQTMIIKTMMIITALFAACSVPNQIYFLLMNLGFKLSMSSELWNGTVFVAFLNISLHPFIYAVKLDTVKKHILSFVCGGIRNARLQPEGNAAVVGRR